ncbi:hypothetical protein PMAYCL1PPCAC_18413, partial [Pristionchus mayeri]
LIPVDAFKPISKVIRSYDYLRCHRLFNYVSLDDFSPNVARHPVDRMDGVSKAELLKRIDDLQSEVDALKQQMNSKEGVQKLQSFQTIPARVYPEVRFRSERTRKRILVTGGTGFVGSHLVDKLLLDGHEVIALDNFFTGRRRNVEHWIGHPNFELVHHDVVNSYFVEVDQIYHLASPASPPHYMYNPVKTIKTNSIGTINMLGLAKRVKATMLLASTSEIYGDPEVHPQPESYWGHVNPIGPRSCYDEGKRVAESLMVAYAKQEQVDIRIARIFNTFGPRMHMNDGRVVSNFIIQAIQDKPMTIYGNGTQTRSFQYVDDLVEGLISLMNSNITSPVNLGNPEEHTISDFAHIIKDLVGSKSEIEHLEGQVDDPQQRKPDIRKAAELIDWQPKVKMHDGIRKTIEYFRKEIHDEEKKKRIDLAMSGPPSKKWKGTVENDEGNDSFDEDDEILDELKSQHSQRVSQSLGPAAISSSNQSPPPTVTLPSQRTVTPGQAVLKTTPTSSRNRFPSSLRNSASTPTSSHGSQDTVSQGEFIAVKFQLTNAQREKDELKYKLAQLNEELTAEKKKMEVEKQKEIRRYQERLKMAEGEVHALRMSNASIIADSSLAGGDGNESVMSVSCASSQRVTTPSLPQARHTHSLPQFVGGNGFRSDIVSTFTHNQSFKMDGEMSFQDVPSQAFGS